MVLGWYLVPDYIINSSSILLLIILSLVFQTIIISKSLILSRIHIILYVYSIMDNIYIILSTQNGNP